MQSGVELKVGKPQPCDRRQQSLPRSYMIQPHNACHRIDEYGPLLGNPLSLPYRVMSKLWDADEI
jgi:hypothetical protein